MQMLVIVLNKVDKVESLFKEFINIGVRGATIIDSKGMARVLHEDIDKIPLFGSIKMLINDQYPYNKTIFVVLEDEQVQPAIDAVKRVVEDLSKPDVGILFSLRVPQKTCFWISPKLRCFP
jgi:nitrogen regulatory protein PII